MVSYEENDLFLSLGTDGDRWGQMGKIELTDLYAPLQMMEGLEASR